MSNYRRAYVPGGRYFFTVVCWRRRPLLASPERVALLREALRTVRRARPFDIDAMVVMPEHLHCIWRLPAGDTDYSSRWRDIKKYVTRRIDEDAGRVWQARFWEHVLRDERDWRRHVDYIHYNPVKHGLVARVGEWPYSSFALAVRRGWYDADWGGVAPRGIDDIECE